MFMKHNPTDIIENYRGMKLIGYGANYAALNTIRSSRVNFDLIVDDNEMSHGKTLAGIPVYPPSVLSSFDWSSTRMIVCAYKPQNIRCIQSKLEIIGLHYPEHWVDCSLFHYETIGAKLREYFDIEPDFNLFWRTRALSLNSQAENMSAISGTWMYLEMLNHLMSTKQGQVAEMGIFRGGNSLITLLLGTASHNWKYHLFDSFQGLSELSVYDPQSCFGEFKDVSLNHIKSVFVDFDNVTIHAGLFRDTMYSVSDNIFNMVYVDCDLYEPTLECCRFLRQAQSGWRNAIPRLLERSS